MEDRVNDAARELRIRDNVRRVMVVASTTPGRYEVNIVLNPNLDQSQLALEKEIIQRALENYGARVEKVEELGLRRLAYPIAKDPQGYFLWYQVEMPEDRVNDLAR
uniref:30S ribosomal protein S6,30S ribosomal protein S6,30S ribosomal protein S6,30S ribosomal protein S6,30S ribosomal protein S6,30S ribosomal protein S6,30S ribosomal protein S6,30S ribosomal protein S6 n=2 Tax=Thermus thermophilus (strain ATCC 27634 / DSM 579 / HB8) TaxID=300852 RepID=UPI00132CDA0E|nr:Chain A, 30S ribosomal protein S6,30S ribosomal protein S6,30S ribosomal protein S6,30S ribosomal protein S6,30S ribosomal protein S6,30S ribosomal protein S6,30S ribosomal protein S6,30S ribosomal protein S6 [Thermus thermophilus HB8]6I6S_B Chain B, 30S ribosomal protein S6,30S ribosomal protein S6,30S ribosomal protein S6,30S ribosomal protein S6,30S ribosomal protein S6,30S ribosomal protein S6,30S ribosomal protein S6,30S ribosomal protein S6 [Thermus thermophilus HB8]